MWSLKASNLTFCLDIYVSKTRHSANHNIPAVHSSFHFCDNATFIQGNVPLYDLVVINCEFLHYRFLTISQKGDVGFSKVDILAQHFCGFKGCLVSRLAKRARYIPLSTVRDAKDFTVGCSGAA